MLIFDVFWSSLGTSIFGNSSSAANNTRSRLPSRLSFRFLYVVIETVNFTIELLAFQNRHLNYSHSISGIKLLWLNWQWEFLLRKILKCQLISWCGNLWERTFSAEFKAICMCISKTFAHQEIRWNYVILRTALYVLQCGKTKKKKYLAILYHAWYNYSKFRKTWNGLRWDTSTSSQVSAVLEILTDHKLQRSQEAWNCELFTCNTVT